jgi:hypothetical protein
MNSKSVTIGSARNTVIAASLEANFCGEKALDPNLILRIAPAIDEGFAQQINITNVSVDELRKLGNLFHELAAIATR